MKTTRDPIRLYGHALRVGDLDLADALHRHFTRRPARAPARSVAGRPEGRVPARDVIAVLAEMRARARADYAEIRERLERLDELERRLEGERE